MYLKVLNKKPETDTMVLYYTVIKINMKLDAESSDPNDITKLHKLNNLSSFKLYIKQKL